jgi:hypothetical protein
LKASPNSIFKSGRRITSPPNRTPANPRLMMVGLTMMKRGSSSQKVSPPNTTTSTAVTTGIASRRPNRLQEAIRERTVATMRTPVAQ